MIKLYWVILGELRSAGDYEQFVTVLISWIEFVIYSDEHVANYSSSTTTNITVATEFNP